MWIFWCRFIGSIPGPTDKLIQERNIKLYSLWGRGLVYCVSWHVPQKETPFVKNRYAPFRKEARMVMAQLTYLFLRPVKRGGSLTQGGHVPVILQLDSSKQGLLARIQHHPLLCKTHGYLLKDACMLDGGRRGCVTSLTN